MLFRSTDNKTFLGEGDLFTIDLLMSGLQNCLFSLQVLPKTLKRVKFMILKMCQSTIVKGIFTECYLYNPFFVFYVASIVSLNRTLCSWLLSISDLILEIPDKVSNTHIYGLGNLPGCLCSAVELASRWDGLTQTAMLLWGASIEGQFLGEDIQNYSAKRKNENSIV